jgi:hypothetical protein
VDELDVGIRTHAYGSFVREGALHTDGRVEAECYSRFRLSNSAKWR